MTTHSPLFLLAALGLLCNAGVAAAQAVDTSQWKCESCPFPKEGVGGSVDIGAGVAATDSPKSGDYTGIDRKGGYLLLGGQLRWRSGSGTWAEASGADLGLDSRSLTARGGQEGKYTLRLDYAEVPRHPYNADGATPFLGVGGDTLSLPAGYPSGSTATMPLASTLQPVSLGYKKKRLDLGGKVIAIDDWSVGVRYTRDTKNGTQPMYGSFFSTASQLVAPVDQVTDTLEVSAAYTTRKLQASLSYQVSRFRNGPESLTWANPFDPVVTGATRGQLALAPDNQMHLVSASAGYEIASWIHVSADVSLGRLTQDQAFLASTTNPTLTFAPALTTSSLDGRVDTFDANVKFSARPMEDLRIVGSWARDVRDNKTSVRTYALIATDLFVNGSTRDNTPFDVTQDRFKLNADYRGIEGVKLAAGVDQDYKRRPYHEVVRTGETTVWGRAGVQPLEAVALTLRASHAERNNSAYGTAIWFGSNENIFLRKYNLADRRRDMLGARADWTVSETMSAGVSLDYANDDYNESLIGLTKARSLNLGVDFSATIAERTQVTAYAQSERIRSGQAGSQAVLYPDWTARNKDGFDVIGVGVKHQVVADSFTVGADLSIARSRSDLTVDTPSPEPQFPSARTATDTLKLYANYKLKDNLWLNGSFWHERYSSSDWHYDGVRSGTIPSLLSLGLQPPRYTVDFLGVTLRYQF